MDDSIMRFGPGRRFVVSWLAAFALVGLGATGSSAAADAQATLTVTLAGTGTGWVTGFVSSGSTFQQVISCGTVCSVQLPVGTWVELVAQAANNSTFAGWSGSCTADSHGGVGGNGCIDEFLQPDTVVQATFNPTPPPCSVPYLKGRTLFTAKRLLKRHYCRVGSITHAFARRVKKGRVISQSPKAYWRLANGAVDLVVSKGRR